MKELSIEEKAKAYDEALKVLHKYDGVNIMFSQDLKEEMFPELKESEDEKSKKWILEYLHDGLRKSDEQFKDHFKVAIAWLEKQGKQKQEVEGNPNARKPTLRIVKGKSYLCIKDYQDKNCTFTKGKIYESDKDGFLVDDEEKDTFERKIWEEDAIEYFFLFEQSKTKDVITDEKQGKKGIKRNNGEIPNSAWSEEDETTLNSILSCIEYCQNKDMEAQYNGNRYVDPKRYEPMVNWLKFLKDRELPMPIKFSEKHEAVLDALIRRLEGEDIHVSQHLAVECLKAIAQQKRWKPTEEQLRQLGKYCPDNTALTSLYDYLKQL